MSDQTAGAGPEPVIVSEERIYEGKIVSLSKIRIQMPDGPLVTREIVHHAGSVGILPLTTEGKIVFVRQFRAPAHQTLLELPAGSLEEGEDPESCARRELTEEIGQTAATMRKIAGFYLAPGWATEFMHAFIATDLSPEKAQGDEDEDIEIVELTPEEALAAVTSGQIMDCKSIAMIGLYFAEKNTKHKGPTNAH